jgi:thiosulfate/3-mercaptopyruvate sulfurtransferase
MGAEDVSVLNGGLLKWKAEGRPMMMGEPNPRTPRHFTARHNLDLVRDVDDMVKAIDEKSSEIVDARSAERFAGSAPEPRLGLRAGHIPGAINVPYKQVLNADGTFKSVDELKEIFLNAGVDPHKPVVTTCGSGITACVLALALGQAGHLRTAVNDGSWAEWGGDERLPIETS